MNLLPVLRQRYFDANGNPLSGGKLYSYQAGTTTPQATYTDSAGGTPNANPVILDANGEATVWADPTLSYKFVLKNSADVTQWTTDNVIGTVTSNAVDTGAIQDGAVTTAKIADDAVTAAKLRDDASIDGNRAVTTNHIRDSAITTAKINNEAVTLAKLATSVQEATAKVGDLKMAAYEGDDDGWLSCVGTAVSRTTYATLFAKIGETHGEGDGTTTFNIPDYRGLFPRMTTGASSRDPDSASRTAMNTGGNTGNNVGSVQGHAFQTHDHPFRFSDIGGASAIGGAATGGVPNSSISTANTLTHEKAAYGSTAQATANETRPINAYVNILIKY